ncbi:MAG: PEGA domain-containing protein [Proteobacteria bacterium]|nr:PEGA domain-containing protein [Pseudomonadota bacterium]
MEFVKVTFPTSRYVYIDGEQAGRTNEVLRIEAGTHVFALGSLANYEPASQELEVAETTVLAPLVVEFARKEK